MSTLPPCPKCKADFTYANDNLLMCPMCFHEWSPEEIIEAIPESNSEGVIKDAHGNVLQNGDSVIIVKDLPVKGASKSLKAGTKVKNIRLTDGDHNIDCRIDGFGSMALKSEYVKKV